MHEICLAEQKSQKMHSVFISISSIVQTASLATGKSAFTQPKGSFASHLSSYLRKLLSCLHAQGRSSNLTLLWSCMCCCHGNGHNSTGSNCSTARHRQGPQAGSLRQCCWRIPQPTAVKLPQTRNLGVAPVASTPEDTGDHLTLMVVAVQLLLRH